MNRSVSLSIVMPVLNEAGGIVAALDRLQPLRARGAELIVVDGGSTDRTAALAAPRVDRLIASPPGRGVQLNAGARAARGAVLLFLHADTTLPDGALERIARAVARARTPASAWGWFDVRIDGRRGMLRTVAWCMNRRARLTRIATGDQAMFVTRRAFDAVGGFPDQALMEVIELSRRLRRLARPVSPGGRVRTSARRWERDGVWRTIVLMWALRLGRWLGVRPDTLARYYR